MKFIWHLHKISVTSIFTKWEMWSIIILSITHAPHQCILHIPPINRGSYLQAESVWELTWIQAVDPKRTQIENNSVWGWWALIGYVGVRRKATIHYTPPLFLYTEAWVLFCEALIDNGSPKGSSWGQEPVPSTEKWTHRQNSILAPRFVMWQLVEISPNVITSSTVTY